MIHSRQLAQIIGPTLSVMTLSEIKNLSIWESTIPSVIYLNAVLFFWKDTTFVAILLEFTERMKINLQ
jgi:high-affinity Fe2+/Pb2+ permease